MRGDGTLRRTWEDIRRYAPQGCTSEEIWDDRKALAISTRILVNMGIYYPCKSDCMVDVMDIPARFEMAELTCEFVHSIEQRKLLGKREVLCAPNFPFKGFEYVRVRDHGAL